MIIGHHVAIIVNVATSNFPNFVHQPYRLRRDAAFLKCVLSIFVLMFTLELVSKCLEGCLRQCDVY